MRIDEVEITGWMPFAETVHLVLPEGPIAVVGSHEGDPRRSNRAGKTSLLEAITWCLYGTHRKRLDDQVINRASTACEVVVRFNCDITVKRSRLRGSSTKLAVNVRDVLADKIVEYTGEAAQTMLNALVGLGLDDYLATSCFRQGDVESIISKSPTERLALVSEWLQQSRWIDARKIQAGKMNVAEARLAERRASLETAASYRLSEEERAAITVELESLRAQREELDGQAELISGQLLESVTAKNQLGLHRELTELRSQLKGLRIRLEGRSRAEREKADAIAAESEARAQHTIAKSELEELLVVRSGGFDGRCPITCESCPVATQVTATVDQASSLFAERRETADARKVEWQKALGNRDAASRAVSEYEREAARFQQTIERGKQISAQLTMTVEQAQAAPEAQPLQLRFDEFRRQAAELARQAGTLSSKLDAAAKHEARHAELALEVEAAERAARVARLAWRAISSVPARIAAQQLTELELEANALLGGTGVSLRFSWARELADKAPLCEECGHVYSSKRGDACPICKAPRGKKQAQELELLCDDGSGAEEDARYNSGGTRAVVGSAIRLAASAMLRRLRSSRAAWAIVDEPFGSLDAENREQLARTFAGMLGHVGLEQALVVSHDPALLAALPHRIVIDKDGSSSTARIE